MSIEFGTSTKGRPTLIYEGYEYVKKNRPQIQLPIGFAAIIVKWNVLPSWLLLETL